MMNKFPKERFLKGQMKTQRKSLKHQIENKWRCLSKTMKNTKKRKENRELVFLLPLKNDLHLMLKEIPHSTSKTTKLKKKNLSYKKPVLET
jgi:hypothetical protein